MKTKLTKKEFDIIEKRMNELLSIATKKGGFEKLTKKQLKDLNNYTKKVEEYEDEHYTIPMPQTVQGLIELKMFEKKLKQKELAKLLNITDTKLSEIMHNKRKPNISFIKAMHQVLGIDGNLLLRVV
ncbi:MAG: helix-turn-helix domain-containing protein [Crocinitomicaceae bacterium]|nr:helix-turn-helix domain-containing protein [Crocinitomicaceae bacterium]MBK8927833.1 helix-turn-helix domain-containing protein [Crocinitomicaceae bacterium]